MRGLREVLEAIEEKREQQRALWIRQDLSRREIGRAVELIQDDISRLRREARDIEVRMRIEEEGRRV